MPLIFFLALDAALGSGTVVALDGPLQGPDMDGRVILPVDAIVPMARWSAIDEHAMRNLGEELLAVRPLMHKFDGELEIMARLQEAIANVHVLRSDEERRLLYVALAFQGFAVQRYFQDELAIDPAAEPYRIVIGDRVEVRAWVDAVAMDPFREPTRLDISEQPELAAFQATRDRMLYQTRATLFVHGVPDGAIVLVDGERVDGDPVAGLKLVPGRHRLTVTVDGHIVARDDFRVGAGDVWRANAPPPRAELDVLIRALATRPSRVDLPPGVARTLEQLPGPVELAVNDEAGSVLYHVDGAEAFRVTPTTSAASSVNGSPAVLRTWIGAAVLHDASYEMLNHDQGAPHASSTRNAGAPMLGIGVLWPIDLDVSTADPLVAGLGMDLFVPAGEWHDLPIGDRSVRLRSHAYLAGGFDRLQFTMGAISPWHAGLGARFQLPLSGSTELAGGIAQGVFPLSTSYDGLHTEPIAPRFAFIALSSAIGR